MSRNIYLPIIIDFLFEQELISYLIIAIIYQESTSFEFSYDRTKLSCHHSSNYVVICYTILILT